MRFIRPVLRLFAVAAASAAVSLPAAARAEKKQSQVIDLPWMVITGRVAKPQATVEISRVTPTIALTELHPPFAEKISQALTGSSFLATPSFAEGLPSCLRCSCPGCSPSVWRSRRSASRCTASFPSAKLCRRTRNRCSARFPAPPTLSVFG